MSAVQHRSQVALEAAKSAQQLRELNYAVMQPAEKSDLKRSWQLLYHEVDGKVKSLEKEQATASPQRKAVLEGELTAMLDYRLEIQKAYHGIRVDEKPNLSTYAAQQQRQRYLDQQRQLQAQQQQQRQQAGGTRPYQFGQAAADRQREAQIAGAASDRYAAERELSTREILPKQKLTDLVKRLDPHEELDASLQSALLDVADDFIDNVTNFACQLAKHRQSNTLSARDVQLHLERNWGMTVPGYGSVLDHMSKAGKPTPNEADQSRRAAVAKSIAMDSAE